MRSAQRGRKQARPGRTRAVRVVVSVGVLTLALAAMTVVAVLPGRSRKVPPKQIEPVDVEVMRIRARPSVKEQLKLHGDVAANRVVDVAAEVAARVKEIHLKEGKPCAAKQPLIQLNTDLLAAEHRRAKATAEFDQREYQRLVTAMQREAATATEVDQARAKAAASQAVLDLAKANLDRAKILAPVAGVLNKVPVEVGEFVAPGDVVAQIVEVDPVKVVVDVPERVIHSVRLGDDHQVLLDVQGRNRCTGEVTYIAELADPKTRTTRVELTVANPGKALANGQTVHKLRSGQIVDVLLTIGVHRNAVMVPLKAVIPLEKGKVVYVVQDARAAQRNVEIGFWQGDEVQITNDALKSGDLLIVQGQQLVGPGQAVRIVRTAAPHTQPATRATTRPAKLVVPPSGGRREEGQEKAPPKGGTTNTRLKAAVLGIQR